MKLWILGGGGLVGSALKKVALEQGLNPIVTDRNDLDITSSDQVISFIRKRGIDSIVIAAAKVGGIKANASGPREFLLENLQIQQSVLLAAEFTEVENLIFLGSSCIYPRDSEQPIKEEFLMTGKLEKSNEAYAIAKISGLKAVEYIARTSGLNWGSVMPSNVYGPRDNFSWSDSHVLASFIRRVVEAKKNGGTEFHLWGDGSVLREFIHSEDLASIILQMLSHDLEGRYFNVGSGSEILLSDLFAICLDKAEIQGSIIWGSPDQNGTPRKLLDSTAASNLLGQLNIRPLNQGVEETIGWLQKNYHLARL